MRLLIRRYWGINERLIPCDHISGLFFPFEDGFGYWVVKKEPIGLPFNLLMGESGQPNYYFWHWRSSGMRYGP